MGLTKIIRRMMLMIIVISSIIIVASVIFYRTTECLPFIGGVLMSVALNFYKIHLIKNTIKQTTELKCDDSEVASRVKSNVVGQGLYRLFLTAVVLVVAALIQIRFENNILWGAIAGVLVFQIAVRALGFFKGDLN